MANITQFTGTRPVDSSGDPIRMWVGLDTVYNTFTATNPPPAGMVFFPDYADTLFFIHEAP